MDEPYRTLLGHSRHETGHYFFFVLARTGPARAEFESLFGDPIWTTRPPIDRTTRRRTGGLGGQLRVVLRHHAPGEDWAETFAHYPGTSATTLDTAAAFGFAPAGATLTTRWRARPGSTGDDCGSAGLVRT